MTQNSMGIAYGKGRRYEQASNDAMTFFVSRADVDFAEMEVGYLAGPPLHFHPDQDEVHYIIQGKLQYQIDGEQVELQQGDYLFLPRGSTHAWTNLQPEPARVLGILTPGGSEGFFKTMAAAQLDAEAQLKLAQVYGAEIIGPPLAVQIARQS